MIGLFLASGAVAVITVATVALAKYSPAVRIGKTLVRKTLARKTVLDRWAALLEGLSGPTSDYPESSAWDTGAPVQPADFSRQLGNLRGALARTTEPALVQQVGQTIEMTDSAGS